MEVFIQVRRLTPELDLPHRARVTLAGQRSTNEQKPTSRWVRSHYPEPPKSRAHT